MEWMGHVMRKVAYFRGIYGHNSKNYIRKNHINRGGTN